MTSWPVVAVVGPTASGKSDLGIELAGRLGGEIINADASQLYRGMDIGTAKVPQPERAGIPHRQIDVLDITDEASVAAYQQHSRSDIESVTGRGGVPILVGGTGLYVRAALDVLDIPPTDPQVRVRLEQRAAQQGIHVLYAELAQQDPAAAAKILPSNERRVIRALEVIELTGRPFSASMPKREFVRDTVMLGLDADRSVLDERIDRRTRQMWDDGLEEEVRSLEGLGLRDGRTASRAIGYSQVLRHLDGELTQEAAIEQTAQATKRLARRQFSWFRPDPRITWLPHDAPDLIDRALQVVRAATDTTASQRPPQAEWPS
ncbi:tRNA (adenosine(37)-N6)-dimethylallyltransferase MiaA [Yimella sp. cx-51]|uniref:tRNA (adenosine(37)-N6)-dimethylallyltransferase MiaA n=1 Tax=Yimella sp. cx-51 TaxID=2770551 RepID=UPI00165D66C3|nr:tRNA (adenosine(37)-N6)-dimethylallyltransferase MiaA [Yimella sp. cx-51]MBC9957217.1 tRNA (adenosine(37)-N6)-dimethylallyltransferase MiaA [Yimella sp. cx-51]QTH37137.1 tRNA (adenosine(37)-N6)-dimethylallyltransferase MiaA [Yimella sp. cx-51]